LSKSIPSFELDVGLHRLRLFDGDHAVFADAGLLAILRPAHCACDQLADFGIVGEIEEPARSARGGDHQDHLCISATANSTAFSMPRLDQ